MLSTVTLKTLHDQRRALAAWTVTLLLLVAMYVAIWPSMRDQPGISDFLDQMPQSFRALFAMSGADLSTPVGYVQVELLSFMGPTLLLLYAVTTGAGAIAGEEDRHTLDLLLSTRVDRTRVLLEKAAALTGGTLLLATVTAAALIGEGALVDMNLPLTGVTAAMLHLGMLALVFGTLALAVGAVTGNSALARGVPAAVAVLAYVVNGLGATVSWLKPLQPFSPFYQYAGHDPLRTGISAPALMISAATVLILTAVAVLGFRRRDIAG